MPASFSFPSTSANFGLPLLFSGQAQKEFFVNQAFTLVDALMQQSVVAASDVPVADASEGDVFRVLPTAMAEWEGQGDSLAVRIAGSWHFVVPSHGLNVYDRSADQWFVFTGQWEAADAPSVPTGGSVIDIEARATISELLTQLSRVGILP